MNKSKTARVVAFVAALGASAALIGAAAQGTGAYFTDSRSGSLSATTGQIRIDSGSTDLSLTNLLPGQYKNATLSYTSNGSQAEDVWVVFNKQSPEYAALTGYQTGLGGFGHFEVAGEDGQPVFSSWNLSNDANGNSGCADNAVGHGSDSERSDYDYTTAGYCGIPGAIKVESSVPAGATRHVTMTFGYTPKLKDTGAADNYQYENGTAKIPFKLVATQVGVTPNTTFAPVG